MKIVELTIRNARLTISILLFLMIAGTMAYISILKEAEPDIQIPSFMSAWAMTAFPPKTASVCCCGQWKAR